MGPIRLWTTDRVRGLPGRALRRDGAPVQSHAGRQRAQTSDPLRISYTTRAPELERRGRALLCTSIRRTATAIRRPSGLGSRRTIHLQSLGRRLASKQPCEAQHFHRQACASAQIPGRARNKDAGRRRANVLLPAHLEIRAGFSHDRVRRRLNPSRKNPFVACRTSREFVGNKSIDLRNVKTFMPAYDRDRGSVVPVYRREKDLAIAWRGNLQAGMANGYISSESAARLDVVFGAFESAYTKALRDFPENGGGAPANY